MSYQVLARKWRPQQFDEVVGQQHVTRTLVNALESGRLAHAYLFVGPRGTGKTTVARILAKALNCETRPTTRPCDRCDSCREIMAGTSLDVLEIDGASNNSVDQVRDLRETVRFAPARGAYKVYIIDEVHMLTTAAFNALLKTLEEPPAHVKFVFATTEPEKVLATIVSRCQRFDLRRISTPEIVDCLRRVAKAESVAVDDAALLAVARGAEGGLRDAESALDQLISFCGKRIAEPDVLSVFGLVAHRDLEALAGHVLTGDVGGILRAVAAFDRNGKDLGRLLVELLGYFRNLLVVMNIPEQEARQDMEIMPDAIARLQATAAGTDAVRVLRVMRLLTESSEKMRYALSRRTLLETTLVQCGRASVAVTIEELLSQVQALKAALGVPGPGAGAELPAAAEPAKKKDR